MSRRSPEQVHEEDGHATPVASCTLCAEPETVEEVRATEQAADHSAASPDTGSDDTADHDTATDDDELLYSPGGSVHVADGNTGALPDADPSGYPDDAVGLPVQRKVDGNPSVTPDRVGPMSQADREAADGVDVATPPSIEKAERERARFRRERAEERGVAAPEPTPKCRVEGCILPEFLAGVRLCGNHWANRPELRPAARQPSDDETEQTSD